MTRARLGVSRKTNIACCAIALLMLSSGCNGARDSGTAKDASDTKTLASAAPAPTAATCFTPGAAPCPGMLPDDFLQNPSTAALLDAADTTLAQSGEAYRQVTCPSPTSNKCPTDQFASSFVPMHARRIDPSAIPPGKVILLGAMRLRPGGKADRKYGAGDGLENTHAKRKLYIVGFHRDPVAGEPQPPNGTIVGGWKLFGFGGGKDIKYLGKEGILIHCNPDHQSTKDHESDFWSCTKDGKLRMLLAGSGIDPTDARLALHCEPGLLVNSDGERREDCETQLRSATKALFTDLPADKRGTLTASFAQFARDNRDNSQDAYWFTCSLGCCTADFQ